MAITKAIIVHGAGGSPQENWFPWLKAELEKLKLTVIVPQFPSGERHSLSDWMYEFSRWKNAVDEQTMMIGHSVGPAFILNFLERSGTGIAAAFLVAPFVGKLGIERFDLANATFTEHQFNWARIKEHCRTFFVYSSDNDPYVPIEKGEFLSAKLDARFKLVRGAGHFNAEAGYTRFPMLLDDVKALVFSAS